MKKVFLIILFLLAAAMVYTELSQYEDAPPYPVLSWKTGICPERYVQVELFREWLRKEGYVDKNGNPLFDIKLEAESIQSTMIQAVSGVGADILDRVPTDAFAAMGILEDITDFAAANGMGISDTYPAMESLVSLNGRQYAYPCNLAVYVLWSNVDLFRKLGMEPPPETWTPEEFERIGKEFTKRANQGLDRQKVFFCTWTPMVTQIARSRGKDLYNETLTAADIDNPVFADALKLHYKWVYEDHLMPSSAERVSMNAESSFGNDGEVSQFIHGQYGMLCIGRYIFMNLRMLDKELPTANHLFPQYEFQNAFIDGRMSAVYAGGKHKEYAKLFLKFLASREYSDLLVESADGLPPNRRMVEKNADYFHPPKYPLEGGPNANEFKWACNAALKNPASPYNKVSNRMYEMLDQVMNNLATPEEALRDTQSRISRYIDETVGANPELKEQYDKDVALQKKIDARKAAGQKIPANWIRNPYYLQYYKFKNLLAAPERSEP